MAHCTGISICDYFETKDFRIRNLTINDVVKDYDAVMSSIEHLRGVLGPSRVWPSADLTFEQDLIDLGWHQKEFQIRSSFTYTVMSLDESKCLGCVYIYPSEKVAMMPRLCFGFVKVNLEKVLMRNYFLPSRYGYQKNGGSLQRHFLGGK